MAPQFEILMCPPDHYTVSYEINPWMKTSHKPDKFKAGEQWNNLFNLYNDLGIKAHQIAPAPRFPDMVFTANAGLVFQNHFIASNFRYPQRQLEKEHYVSWFKNRGSEIHFLPSDHIFEGQGDALFFGETLFAGYRYRSDIQTHLYIGEIIEREIISLELVNPNFYHLDTCFCPLDGQSALYYPEAFDDYGKKAMLNIIDRLIPVNKEDAYNFCCNAVVVDKRIIINQCSPELQNKLESLGFEVFKLEFDQFLKAGGSAKCLTLLLNVEGL